MANKQGAAAVTIRRAEPGDVPFISASWKQHFWKESRWGDRMRWQDFDAGHSRVIAALLSRSQVLVGCDAADASEIFGYFVFEPEARIAHWAYVKPMFRRMGVFSVLLMASDLPTDLDGVRVTHATRSWFSTRPLMAGNRELKPGTVGLDAKFTKAVHDPYPWVLLSPAETKAEAVPTSKEQM